MTPFWLLADSSVVMHTGDRFRPGGEQFTLAGLAVLGAVILSVLVLGWMISRVANIRELRGSNHPRELFFELCRAHQLNRAQQRLLERVARHYRLVQPARVFIEPALFELVGPRRPSERLRRELDELKRQIFREPAAVEKGRPPFSPLKA